MGSCKLLLKMSNDWKSCSASSPRAQSASLRIFTPSSFQGALRVGSCSDSGVNPCRGGWQVPTSRSHYVRLSSLSLSLFKSSITASFYLLTGLKMLFYRHLIFPPQECSFNPLRLWIKGILSYYMKCGYFVGSLPFNLRCCFKI